MKLNDFVQLNQNTVAITKRGKCSRNIFSRFPQHNMNEVSTEYGTLIINVHAQPHFTKYKLNKLSERAKYVRGYGAKSPINDTKNKLPRYNTTFKFVSKKMIFLHMCNTTMSNTSFMVAGSAVGRVPLVSPRCGSNPLGRKFIFVELAAGFRFVAICKKISTSDWLRAAAFTLYR